MNEEINGEGRKSQNIGNPPISGKVQAGFPEFESEVYLPYLEEFDISEEQKTEILRNLWFIMATFVQIGYGLDSIQYFIPALEKVAMEPGDTAISDPNLVHDFSKAANDGESQ